MDTFEELRVAYDAARDELFRLIDMPDKSMPVAEYRAQLKAAKLAHDEAHVAMMAAWT